MPIPVKVKLECDSWINQRSQCKLHFKFKISCIKNFLAGKTIFLTKVENMYINRLLVKYYMQQWYFVEISAKHRKFTAYEINNKLSVNLFLIHGKDDLKIYVM